MTITYMFRAKARPGQGFAEGDAAFIAKGPDADDPVITMPNPFPVPESRAAREPAAVTPAAAAPLLLVDPAVVPEPAPALAPNPAPEKPIAPALAAPGGALTRYAPTDSRIILVAKARGGIGATTLAVNLALEMQGQAARRSGAVGGRVALVDLDVQLGNAGSLLDIADRGGMVALARLGSEPDGQAVRHAMLRHPSGLSVLTAPTTAIPFEAFDATRIASILDALSAEYDVVIVDLPPALIDWLEPLLARAERLLMVTDLAVPSIMRARRIVGLMTEDRPDLPVEIVVAHERKPFRLGQTHRDAATALGRDLTHWLPDEAKLARQAMDRGEPLVQLAPRCAWSKAVRSMAETMKIPKNKGAQTALRGDH